MAQDVRQMIGAIERILCVDRRELVLIADKWCVDISDLPVSVAIGGAEWKKDEITEPKKEKSLLTHISKCIRQGERKTKPLDDKKQLTES